MSDNTLERLVSGYMRTRQPQYVFGWQGGEPLLMGVAFFQRVTELQKKYGSSGTIVSNGLQTNAVLITDEIASHFARYNFLVGVSLDGPDHIHDAWRRNAANVGSHASVMRGVDCLVRHGVDFNILTLVTSANVRQPETVYRYLCDHGFTYHQYIPCVEFGSDGNPLPFTITGEEWGDFLCGLYDEWATADSRRVSVRLFDAIIGRLLGDPSGVCHMEKNCCQYFLVEHNGDVYPCDFFVEKALRIGNITETGWNKMAKSQVYLRFGAQKNRWNENCSHCDYLELCAGDCLKHRLNSKRDPKALSLLCSGWRKFYDHSISGFRRIARQIRNERSRYINTQMTGNPKSPARNDPCSCGSKKKYKHCCLRH